MTETQFVVLLLALVAAAVVYTLWRGWRQSAIYEKVEQMASQVEELTLRVVALELERAGYRLWNSQLRGQVIELGHTPVPPPPWLVVTVAGGTTAVDAVREPGEVMVEAYHKISRHFSNEELDDLALRAGIEAGAFGGDTQLARARELVETAFRHGRLAELVEEARRLRPRVEWPRMAAAGWQSNKE